jgi:UDP-glucose 4-epimerase
MKILVTGVAGFIGSHVATRFLREGYDVVGVDDLSVGKLENIPADVQFIEGDLAKEETISKIPTDCKLILHLAGQSSGEISFDDPVADLEKNTITTLNLIQYGIQNNADRIVYASSMSVYGEVPDVPINEDQKPQPLSCYGVGKLASEGYLKVHQKKLPFVALRMFNVYGPGQDLNNLRQGMVSIYIAYAVKLCKIEVKGSINRYRDFIYIDDVVEAWFRSATYPEAQNQVLNVGTGRRTSINELLEKICNSVPGSNFFVSGATPGDQNGIYADNSKLRKILGINQFTDITNGIPIFAKWASGYFKNIKHPKKYN